jgi:hypothetical protein
MLDGQKAEESARDGCEVETEWQASQTVLRETTPTMSSR